MKPTLTHTRIFKMYANEAQTINSCDMKVILKCLGYVIGNGFAVPEKQFTFEEFTEYIATLDNTENEQMFYGRDAILAAFQELDNNDTGYVGALELKQVLLDNCKDMTEEEIIDFFTVFPPNSKGELCYKVLVEKLFTKQQ